jgi:hypothetical protein
MPRPMRGKVNLATPSKGTGPYMAAELFKMMVGIDIVYVPFPPVAPSQLGTYTESLSVTAPLFQNRTARW